MPTEPWAAYPPEMNAARIIGSGPAGLFTAAASWAVMSAQTAAGQAIFMAQNANQAMNLLGPTSDAVNATAPPFGSWMADFTAESARNAAEYQTFAQSYIAAMSTMVPLPVIIANRVQSAAGHAASAAGAVNPVGLAADAQYEAFRVQNASVMSTYDAVSTGSATPRTYAAPPPLVAGGGSIRTGEDVVDAAVQGTGASGDPVGAFNGAVAQAEKAMANPSTVAGLNNTAAGAGTYGAAPAAVSPLAMQQTAMAMSPAAMVAGQMASPQGPAGVSATGLGSGSQAMAPLRTGGGGGGLPISTSSPSSVSSTSSPSSSVSTSTGGGRSTPNLSSLASLLGGSGAGAGSPGTPGAPAAPGSPGAPAGGARPFSGIPASVSPAGAGGAGTGHGPMGAVPPAAGQGKSKETQEIDAKSMDVADPVAEQRAKNAALARFR